MAAKVPALQFKLTPEKDGSRNDLAEDADMEDDDSIRDVMDESGTAADGLGHALVGSSGLPPEAEAAVQDRLLMVPNKFNISL